MALLRRQPWYLRNDLALPDVSSAQKQAHSALFCWKGAYTGDLAGTAGAEGAPPNSAKLTLKQTCDSLSVSTGDLLGGGVFNDANWVRASAGNPHTWWWGQFSSGLRVLMSYESGVDYNVNMWGAFDDFTGGTTTARPTSVSEFPLFGNNVTNTGQFVPNNTANCKMHFSFAADGSNYMLGSMDGQGGPAFGAFIGKLDNPTSGVTKPFAGGILGVSWNGGVNAIGTASFQLGGRSPNNTQSGSMASGFPNFQFGNLTGVTGLGADGLSPQEPIPIYYWPGITAGVGRMGFLPDAFWSAMLPSDRMGPPTPPAAQYEYTRTGALWIPWSLLPTY